MKRQHFILIALTIVFSVVAWFIVRLERPADDPAAIANGEAPSLPHQAGFDRVPPRPETAVTPPPAQTSPLAQTHPDELSPGTRAIVDDRADYSQRLAAARAVTTLATNLAAADRDALYAFLLKRNPLDEEQRGHVLKNVLMDKLCELQPPSLRSGEVLMQVYGDPGQHVVIRDYAVQHLVEFYRRTENVPELDTQATRKQQEQIQAVLWTALGETDRSIGGTALLGLTRLSEDRPEFDRRQIAVAALRLTRDGEAGEWTRITAMQISAELGVNDALPALLQTAQAGGSIPLRVSAIGALGRLGDATAVPLLTKLAAGTEPGLSLPATRALAQINRRTQATREGDTPL